MDLGAKGISYKCCLASAVRLILTNSVKKMHVGKYLCASSWYSLFNDPVEPSQMAVVKS